MKKVFILLVFILSLLFISACSTEDITSSNDKETICNLPYIRFETGCCLDNDNNSICDSDETNLETTNSIPVENQEDIFEAYWKCTENCDVGFSIKDFEDRGNNQVYILLVYEGDGHGSCYLGGPVNMDTTIFIEPGDYEEFVIEFEQDYSIWCTGYDPSEKQIFRFYNYDAES